MDSKELRISAEVLRVADQVGDNVVDIVVCSWVNISWSNLVGTGYDDSACLAGDKKNISVRTVIGTTYEALHQRCQYEVGTPHSY